MNASDFTGNVVMYIQYIYLICVRVMLAVGFQATCTYTKPLTQTEAYNGTTISVLSAYTSVLGTTKLLWDGA